jgi:hypothetical protein
MNTVNKVIESKPNYFWVLHGESVVKKSECSLPLVPDLSGYIWSVLVDNLHIFDVAMSTKYCHKNIVPY